MTDQELELIAIMKTVATNNGYDDLCDCPHLIPAIAQALIEEGYVKARDNQGKD